MAADIATTLNAWSSTSSSNQPDTSDPVGPNTLAQNLQVIQSVMRAASAGDGTIASATTTDLSTVNDGDITVSGTTTITGFGTLTAGIKKILTFSGALTLTHNATSLILPGAANITTAAGDVAIMRSLGAGNWKCMIYQRAANVYAASGANADITSLTGLTTALSVAQGGTASTTAAAARTALSAAASGANADITSMTALTAINRTGGTSIKGTNTNNNAAAGDVGEYIESTIAVGAAVSLTTGVVTNITSISLTAGDWDVSGVVLMDSGATTNVTRVTGGISSTSATADVTKGYYSHIHSGYVPGSGQFRAMPLNTSRFSLSGTTTIYLLALANFTVSTCTAYGTISARRVR